MSTEDREDFYDATEFWEAYLQSDLAEFEAALRRHGDRFLDLSVEALAAYLKERHAPPPADEPPF